MKTTTFIATIALLASPYLASAQTIIVEGREYHGIYLKKVEPDGLTIGHSAGVAKLPFEKLPESVQKYHGYSPEKAAQYRAELAAKQAATPRPAPKRTQDPTPTPENAGGPSIEDLQRLHSIRFDLIQAERELAATEEALAKSTSKKKQAVLTSGGGRVTSGTRENSIENRARKEKISQLTEKIRQLRAMEQSIVSR